MNVKPYPWPSTLYQSRPSDHQHEVGPSGAIRWNLGEPCSHHCQAASFSFKLQTTQFAHQVLPTPPFLFPLQVPTLVLIQILLRHGGKLQPSTPFSFLYQRMKHWCESPSGKMEPVSGGVRGGLAPGGPILYCCPDDLERVPWKHFLPWLHEVSWWLWACVVTKPFHLRKERNHQRQKAGNNSRSLLVPEERKY